MTQTNHPRLAFLAVEINRLKAQQAEVVEQLKAAFPLGALVGIKMTENQVNLTRATVIGYVGGEYGEIRVKVLKSGNRRTVGYERLSLL